MATLQHVLSIDDDETAEQVLRLRDENARLRRHVEALQGCDHAMSRLNLSGATAPTTPPPVAFPLPSACQVPVFDGRNVSYFVERFEAAARRAHADGRDRLHYLRLYVTAAVWAEIYGLVKTLRDWPAVQTYLLYAYRMEDADARFTMGMAEVVRTLAPALGPRGGKEEDDTDGDDDLRAVKCLSHVLAYGDAQHAREPPAALRAMFRELADHCAVLAHAGSISPLPRDAGAAETWAHIRVALVGALEHYLERCQASGASRFAAGSEKA